MSAVLALVGPFGPVTMVAAPVACVIALWVGRRLARLDRRSATLGVVAFGGLLFQAMHGTEHGIQLAHWFADPSAAPWLGRLAVVGRDTLAGAVGGSTSLGNELLHLVGNAVYLVGVLAALRLAADGPAESPLRRARFVQALHLAEHVLLTTTVIVTGRAIGVTTAFGLLEPGGTLGIGVRVWAHFLLNLIPSVLVVQAGLAVLRRRRGISPARVG